MLAEAEQVRVEAEQQLAAAREVSASAAASEEALRQREAAATEAIAVAGVRAAAAEESDRQLHKEHAERQQRFGALLFVVPWQLRTCAIDNLVYHPALRHTRRSFQPGGETWQRLFARADESLSVFAGEPINRITEYPHDSLACFPGTV